MLQTLNLPTKMHAKHVGHATTGRRAAAAQCCLIIQNNFPSLFNNGADLSESTSFPRRY